MAELQGLKVEQFPVHLSQMPPSKMGTETVTGLLVRWLTSLAYRNVVMCSRKTTSVIKVTNDERN